MTRLATSANSQYLDLVDHDLERDYDQAAERLSAAIEQAAASIDAYPSDGKDFPAIYDKMVWPDVKWIKVHRYWFSYTTTGKPVIFNII